MNNLTTEERQRQVAFHEREAARLQGEVSSGAFDKALDYLNALNRADAVKSGIDLPDLAHVDTPPCPPVEPQAQVNVAYLDFLVARKATLETAIRSACYYLSIGSPARAQEVLNQSLTQ